MRYLVTSPSFKPFFTQYFIIENNLSEDIIVFDLLTKKYIEFGKSWVDIESDNL